MVDGLPEPPNPFALLQSQPTQAATACLGNIATLAAATGAHGMSQRALGTKVDANASTAGPGWLPLPQPESVIAVGESSLCAFASTRMPADQGSGSCSCSPWVQLKRTSRLQCSGRNELRRELVCVVFEPHVLQQRRLRALPNVEQAHRQQRRHPVHLPQRPHLDTSRSHKRSLLR